MSLLTESTRVRGAGAGAATESGIRVQVLTDRCAGCQECIIRCPTGALHLDVDRWVARADDHLCVGCRQCVRTCPFSAIDVTGPVGVTARAEDRLSRPSSLAGDVTETHRGFTTWAEALAEANRCLSCPDPTCVRGCPAHNDIPGFISAVRDGDLQAAHRVLHATSVMPDICSRVCNQAAQCEGACTWSLAGDAPVSIGRLERFVADSLPVAPPEQHGTRGEGLSVAIVGSGPAAIAAAWTLVEEGARVTVYERETSPGGVLTWGIPDFTLPGRVAARPWVQLAEAGVQIHCDVEVAPADVQRLVEEHDAVILAVGASQAMRLSVPGADLDGVVDATRFLRGAKSTLGSGGSPERFLSELGLPTRRSLSARTPPRVLVLGAGNTAMDVARSARRLGLEATCIDWLDERFALARPEELEEARREGVEVRFSRTLLSLEGDHGRATCAELATTTQARPDRPPKVSRTQRERLAVDLVVMAMGYRVDPSFAKMAPGLPVRRVASGIPDRRWTASGVLAGPASSFAHRSPVGTLALGREVGTSAAAAPIAERVWAVGDALVGPSTVVEAMAHGRVAAHAVMAGTAPSR